MLIELATEDGAAESMASMKDVKAAWVVQEFSTEARAVARVERAPPGSVGVAVKNSEITDALGGSVSLGIWNLGEGRGGRREGEGLREAMEGDIHIDAGFVCGDKCRSCESEEDGSV